MKKILISLMLGILFLTSGVFATYTPTAKDTVWLNKVYNVLDKLSTNNPKKLPEIIKKLESFQRKTKSERISYLVKSIIVYIDSLIAEDEIVDIENVIGNDKTSIVELGLVELNKGLRPTYEDKGNFYLLRIAPNVKNGEPKNLVLQTYFNHGQCLELADLNLPKDFTYYSMDGKNRESIKNLPATDTSALGINTYYPMTCGAFYIKIEFPKQRDLFKDGLAFPILNNGHFFGGSRCFTFTLSADNAQYTEQEYCR